MLRHGEQLEIGVANIDKKIISEKIVECINKAFAYKKISVTSEDESLPLTGRKINLTSADMIALYRILCKEFETEIRIENIWDFWSIDKIADRIMKESTQAYDV